MKKKGFCKTHGTKCYDNYLESMESTNTTILWHQDTIRLVYFENVLIIKSKHFDEKGKAHGEYREIAR